MQKPHFTKKQNILDNSKETLATTFQTFRTIPNKIQIIPEKSNHSKKTNHSNKSQIIPQKAKTNHSQNQNQNFDNIPKCSKSFQKVQNLPNSYQN